MYNEMEQELIDYIVKQDFAKPAILYTTVFIYYSYTENLKIFFFQILTTVNKLKIMSEVAHDN
jgi:hypothetical protein